MKITEADIFSFIFYPDELESEKADYIERNKNEFKDQLENCRALKNDVESGETSTPEKLYSLTNLVNKRKVIDFIRIEHKKETAPENYKLAAASPDLQNKAVTDTYINRKEKFLIKVISTQESNKIYLFNETGSEVNNYELILSPSGKILKQETNNIPAIISPAEKIDNIKLVM